MLYLVEYKTETATYQGFAKASNKKDAMRIAEENLDTRWCKVVGATEAKEHQITPRSITFNFRNTAQYALFGEALAAPGTGA